MPILMCASCRKLISISLEPGGNPTARESPGMMAMFYADCERCEKPYCDGCVNQAGGTCPDCGKKVALSGPPPGDPV